MRRTTPRRRTVTHRRRRRRRATGSASSTPKVTQKLDWPFPVGQAFVVSIRPDRYRALQRRMGPWKTHLRLWRGTNGRTINKEKWVKSGRVANRWRLRRGQIGCYDSHLRLWKHIVQKKMPMAIIFEDDVNITYSISMQKKIRRAFRTVKEKKLDWDIFYLGRNRPRNNRRKLAPGITEPIWCQGFFAYAVTLRGARILAKNALPMRKPCDSYAGVLGDRRKLKAIAMHPRLCYVVPVRSDTRHIK